MISKIETLKKLGLLLGLYFIVIVCGIVLSSILLLRMQPSSLQVILIFLASNMYWAVVPTLRSELGISFTALRALGAVTPVLWFFTPYIAPNGGFDWGYATNILSTRWSLLKNAAMYPAYLSNYQIIYICLDVLAIITFAFAIAPVIRGEKFQFLGGSKNEGSGLKDTTARLADARWATSKEVQTQFSASGGIVLGETTNPRIESPTFSPIDPKSWGAQGKGNLLTLDPAIGNGHTLVISESNGYKTAGIVIPNILNYSGPILLLDPKGDLFARTAEARRTMGFNPMKISHDDGIDPLSILKPLMDEYPSVFFHLAENLLPEGPQSTENSKYFRDRGLDLLSGLLYHFVAANDPNVLKRISEMLSLPMKDLIEEAVTLGMASPHPFVRNPLLRLQAVDSKGFESLVRSISNKFKFAEFPDIRGYIVEPNNGKKYAEVLKPKTDVYINVPSRVLKSFSPMVHLLLASILTTTQMLEQPERPSARRLLILDEAKGLGNMDVLELIRDEGRAVGLHLMMIYQTWGQMKKIWGADAASAWEDSVDARIIGATQDT